MLILLLILLASLTQHISAAESAGVPITCQGAALGLGVGSQDHLDAIVRFKRLSHGDFITTTTDPSFQIKASSSSATQDRLASTEVKNLVRLVTAVVRKQNTFRRRAVVVDVGAGEGTFTLLAARLGAEVLAVEPDAARLGNLIVAAEQNRLQRRIHVYPIQATDVPSNRTRTDGGGTCVATLDAIVQRRSVALLLIDVDGYELAALRSAQQLFRSAQVRFVLAYIGPVKKWTKLTQQRERDGVEALEMMRRFGYTAWVPPGHCADILDLELHLPLTPRFGVPMAKMSPQWFKHVLRVMRVSNLQCVFFWFLEKT